MRPITRTLTNIALAAFLTSVGTVASARCPTDLKGVWQSYVLIGEGVNFSSCTFTTDRFGNLEDGSTCQLIEAVIGGGAGDALPVTGQYLVDGDTCDVTGSLSIANDFVVITILKASMSNDGATIRGVQYETFTSGPSEFSMNRIN
jgi:hypothetical protein